MATTSEWSGSTGEILMTCVKEYLWTLNYSNNLWYKLTKSGYLLNCPAPEVVNIITPTGYSTQIRLKRLPSYARYVR